ncbi:hypothetical protein [Photobacterium sp. Hal280]|uniref:hypothetical protein n=1 Tax=Photobacterium sp. Hal280 TaxID=3035163 RepID=UPI00301E4973
MFKHLLTGGVLLISSLPLKADPWSDTTRINWIYPTASGLIFATQDYSNKELSNCDNGHRFIIPRSTDNYEVMSSSMIAAFMADKRVKINIDGESLSGAVCEPSINRFIVFK